MMAKTKKRILLVIGGLALIAAIVGYSMYNKKHFSVQTATPVASLSAVELHNFFSTDSVTAKSKFIGDEVNHKVIEVSGGVSAVDTGQHTVIKLKTATDGAFINCEMEGTATTIKPGDNVVIKGICNGYLFEADLGIPGDVNMNRCFIKK